MCLYLHAVCLRWCIFVYAPYKIKKDFREESDLEMQANIFSGDFFFLKCTFNSKVFVRNKGLSLRSVGEVCFFFLELVAWAMRIIHLTKPPIWLSDSKVFVLKRRAILRLSKQLCSVMFAQKTPRENEICVCDPGCRTVSLTDTWLQEDFRLISSAVFMLSPSGAAEQPSRGLANSKKEVGKWPN